MAIVIAKTSTTYRWNDRLVRVRAGQAWTDDDPFVQAHPELFSGPAGAPEVVQSSEKSERVETAAKRPGGKRAKAKK